MFGNSGTLKHFAVLSVLVLMFAFFAGCTGNSANNAQSTTGFAVMDKTSPSASVIAETKTGADKIQATIEAALADGTYADQVTYTYHPGTEKEGKETVDFSITVKDDVVTAVSVKANEPAPWSAKVIDGFSKELPNLVVGKKIEDINLPKNVGGSSLTSAAFQQYVDKLLAK